LLTEKFWFISSLALVLDAGQGTILRSFSSANQLRRPRKPRAGAIQRPDHRSIDVLTKTGRMMPLIWGRAKTISINRKTPPPTHQPQRALTSVFSLIKIWFSILQGRSLSDVSFSFTPLRQIEQHLDACVKTHNDRAEPFVRTKTKVRQRPQDRLTQLSSRILANERSLPRVALCCNSSQ
jgi:hypothetical protein